MKTQQELQKYIDEFFTQFDYATDEYDFERVASMLSYELITTMCQYISPECAKKNMIFRNRGYNV